MSSRRYYSIPFFGGLAAVLSGCTGSSTAPANIDYRQIGLCDTYSTPGGVQTSKPNEVSLSTMRAASVGVICESQSAGISQLF